MVNGYEGLSLSRRKEINKILHDEEYTRQFFTGKNIKKFNMSDEGVELYYSPNDNTVTGIDVSPDASCVRLPAIPGIDGADTKTMRYSMKCSEKTFPNVTELVIDDGVIDISIPNSLFPNVRKVTSASRYYKTGFGLKYFDPYSVNYDVVLQNSFCLREDENVDLSDVNIIGNMSLDGCKSLRFVNDEQVNKIETEGLKGSAVDECNDVVVIGNILAKIPEAEYIDIRPYVTSVHKSVSFKNVKKVSVHNVDAAFAVVSNILSDSGVTIDTIEVKSNDVEKLPDLLSLNMVCIKNIEITNSNDIFKTVDGILYSKDGEILLKCPALKTDDLVIPNGVTQINDTAFYNCKIKSVKLPDSLKYIGKFAFSHCENLEQIGFGNGIKQIADECRCLDYCVNIKKLTLPDSILYIGNSAFGVCDNIKDIILPNRVEIIGENIFSSVTTEIKKVTLPESLLTVGRYNFFDVDEVVLNGHCPKGLISAIARLFSLNERNKAIKIIDGENVYFLPSAIAKDKYDTLNRIFNIRYIDEDFMMRLYEYSSSRSDAFDIIVDEFLLGGKYQDAVSDVLIENFVNVCRQMIDYNEIDKLTQLISHAASTGLTKKIEIVQMRQILEMVQKINDIQLIAMMLKEIKKENPDFSL